MAVSATASFAIDAATTPAGETSTGNPVELSTNCIWLGVRGEKFLFGFSRLKDETSLRSLQTEQVTGQISIHSENPNVLVLAASIKPGPRFQETGLTPNILYDVTLQARKGKWVVTRLNIKTTTCKAIKKLLN